MVLPDVLDPHSVAIALNLAETAFRVAVAVVLKKVLKRVADPVLAAVAARRARVTQLICC